MLDRHNRKSFANVAPAWRRTAVSVALAALAAGPTAVSAFEIDTGNPDIVLRFDNTIRYNAGIRMNGQNGAILGAVNNDDGDRNFEKNSMVANRFDDLMELDIVYKGMFGARVSGAFWWDGAYRNLDNKNNATSNTLVNGLPVAGALSPYTKRYAEGPSGEFLDAFVFANIDVGGMPLSIKAGQHTVFWGDSLLLGGAIHGVSYAQNSLDVWKGLATPGAEAKELFRPKGGLTLQLQPTADLSIAGQWFYNWQAVRYPESGSYLTIQDALNFGGDSLITGANPGRALNPSAPALGRMWRGQDITPDTNSGSQGDWGISARWSPAWVDGTIGAYYRNATDIQPQLMVTPGIAAGIPPATCGGIGGQPLPGNNCIINRAVLTQNELLFFGKLGQYNAAYATDIKIMGLTLSKNIGGISWGAEISYRKDMALISDPVTVLPAPLVNRALGQIATTEVPTKGTPGALGDTYHGLLNGLATLPKTPLFDTASLLAEMTWMRWGKVTQNEAVFKGRAGYTAIDAVSKNFIGLGINFTPTWFQVFPGVDLLMPVTWAQGLSGNAAVSSGGNKGAGSWSAGIAADVYSKYRFDLKYSDYFGNYTTNPLTGAVTVFNGVNASLQDRGFLSLTFKTTF